MQASTKRQRHLADLLDGDSGTIPLPDLDEDHVPVHFDTRRFPLVVATVPHGADAADQIAPFYEEWDAVMAKGRHAILLDMRGVDTRYIGAVERRKTAAEAGRRRERLRASLVAEARVCPNVLVRAAMTAFDWIAGGWFVHPIEHFATMDEAEAWLRTKLVRPD